MKKFKYYKSCVSFTQHECRKDGGLIDCIDQAIPITRRTFLNHAVTDLAEGFGYAKHWKQGMTMASDWHIGYYRSKLFGKRCYYIKHSAIEFIFLA